MTEFPQEMTDLLEIPPFLDRRGKMFVQLSPEERAARPASKPQPDKTPIVPVPEGAPPMAYKHQVYGAPTSAWAYQDPQGQLVGYVCRWDFTDEAGKRNKQFLPVTFCRHSDGRTGWTA